MKHWEIKEKSTIYWFLLDKNLKSMQIIFPILWMDENLEITFMVAK